VEGVPRSQARWSACAECRCGKGTCPPAELYVSASSTAARSEPQATFRHLPVAPELESGSPESAGREKNVFEKCMCEKVRCRRVYVCGAMHGEMVHGRVTETTQKDVV
jgi:hypothetical protein